MSSRDRGQGRRRANASISSSERQSGLVGVCTLPSRPRGASCRHHRAPAGNERGGLHRLSSARPRRSIVGHHGRARPLLRRACPSRRPCQARARRRSKKDLVRAWTIATTAWLEIALPVDRHVPCLRRRAHARRRRGSRTHASRTSRLGSLPRVRLRARGDAKKAIACFAERYTPVIRSVVASRTVPSEPGRRDSAGALRKALRLERRNALASVRVQRSRWARGVGSASRRRASC